MKSKIQDIKNELWNLLIFYLENYKKNFDIFKTDKGELFLKKLISNKEIAEFQWMVRGNYEYSLLDIYCKHFLESFLIYYIKNVKKVNENNIISNDFIGSAKLKELFNAKFERLEKEILLSNFFEYLILIPTFRIYFPKNGSEIVLDDQHKIRNIYNVEKPYGEELSKFKQAPNFWFPFGATPGAFKEANASVEVKIVFNKKLATDTPYIESEFIPTAPFPRTFANNDQFDEKVLSIHDFFLCYSREDNFRPFTFGQTYYIKLPPFSQNYEYLSRTLGLQFSHPEGFLDLKKQNILDKWISCWKQNYINFYTTFYKNLNDDFSNIFRYSLETIRTFQNIPFFTMQNFLLISTLEGLVYVESIKQKLKKKGLGKKYVMAEVFTKLSADSEKKWRFLVDENYFQKDKFDQINHDNDIKKFINSAYQYRNNIAHPEEKRKIVYEPKYFYNNETSQRYEYILAVKISEWFKKFIRFLLNVWIEKKIKNQTEWYKYIESLF